jgi:hypothetical protein
MHGWRGGRESSILLSGIRRKKYPVRWNLVSPAWFSPLRFFSNNHQQYDSMQRRDFLKNTTLLTGLGLLANAAPSAAAAEVATKRNPPKFGPKFVSYGGDDAQNHLTYYNYESQAWFRKNNTVLTAYRANGAQKYPYWYPLAGPKSGLSLVAETGSPWPHHRGIFFGCDRVNKGNYWQNALKDGQIVSQGYRLEAINEIGATFTDRALWAKPKQSPIIEDSRRYELKLLDDSRYVLDAYFELLPLVDITIEPTNHGLFGIRCAPDISVSQGAGTLEISTGVAVTAADGKEAVTTRIHGQTAKWAAFYGKRANLNITEGVAVLVPDGLPEPFGNQKWFARNYGNISPMPMMFLKKNENIKLPKDKVVKLRYRVVAFVGTPVDAGVPALWDEFNAKKA